MLALAFLYSHTNASELEMDFTKNKEWKFLVEIEQLQSSLVDNVIRHDKDLCVQEYAPAVFAAIRKSNNIDNEYLS